jgi:hypothetical protein
MMIYVNKKVSEETLPISIKNAWSNSNKYRSFLCNLIPNCKFTIQPVFILDDLIRLIEK